MSVTVLELLIGATSAVTELVLSILAALRDRGRLKELSVDRAGICVDVDERGRHVDGISHAFYLLRNALVPIWTPLAASRT